jgi:hypothetical protein
LSAAVQAINTVQRAESIRMMAQDPKEAKRVARQAKARCREARIMLADCGHYIDLLEHAAPKGRSPGEFKKGKHVGGR